MRKLLLFTVFVAGFLVSCGDDEITRDPATLGHDYYPLAVGNYWIFNVTERSYRNNVVDKRSSYQTRERVDAIIEDQTGREWYRVELSRRSSATGTWIINGVKLISRSNSDLQVQTNNQTLVQMIYPVKEGTTFNSNAFIDGATRVELTYVKVGEPFSENDQTFENTVTVLNDDFEEVIDQIQNYDVFAFGVGPVKRSTISHFYCNDPSPSSYCNVGTKYIVSGTDKTEVLESSGKAN
jgi:hypothetical protein